MLMFMKTLNNISRSQATYRYGKISKNVGDLQAGHYSYALAICRDPGRSQEELARELCVNKSTVARNLNYLENKGYITRIPLPHDRRHLSVHPTEKLLSAVPYIKEASIEWMTLLSEGIPKEELDTFNDVLMRMQERAREIIEKQGTNLP